MLLRMLRVMLKGDNAECEGVNSVVRDETTRSPHMSLELLAARVSLKRQLSLGSSSKKWSIIKPLATAIADKCVSHFEDGRQLLSLEDRWAAPSAEVALPLPNADDHAWPSWASPHHADQPVPLGDRDRPAENSIVVHELPEADEARPTTAAPAQCTLREVKDSGAAPSWRGLDGRSLPIAHHLFGRSRVLTVLIARHALVSARSVQTCRIVADHGFAWMPRCGGRRASTRSG